MIDFAQARFFDLELGVLSGYFPEAHKKTNFKSSYDAYYSQIQSNWQNQEQTILIEFKALAFKHRHTKDIHHHDIRDLYFLQSFEEYEIKFGISSVFWGVAESQNLVNIINQQDTAVSFDNKDKLGQPMFQFTYDFIDLGVSNFFILPYFRKRPDSPETLGGITNLQEEQYQSEDKESHEDYAFRHSIWLDNHDIAFSYFNGTDRLPEIRSQGSNSYFYYYLMQQYGLEYQYSYEGWLWKLEAINKKRQLQSSYWAFVSGFEYTIVGFYDQTDLGLILEYNYDDRVRKSDNLLQHDTFLGLRYSFNDEDSSSILYAIVYDDLYQSYTYQLNIETRLFEDIKLDLQYTQYDLAKEDPFKLNLNHLDNISLKLAYYF